jgi:Na+/melibiose symporter-like transporter
MEKESLTPPVDSPPVVQKSFSSQYFWPLALAQFSYLFGLTSLHAIGWFHYLLDLKMDIEWLYVGGYLYLTVTTFVQLFVSNYMDNLSTKSALGRRKPFLGIGYVILAINIVIMVFPPDTDSTTLGLWWCIFGTLGACGSDIMNLSLTAWLLENTDDQADYLRITTKIKTVSQVIGHLLALGLTKYVKNGPLIAAGVYIGVGAISTFLVFRIPRKGVEKDVPPQPPMLPSIRIAANSPLFRKLVSSYIWILSGRDMVAVSILFLIQFDDYPEVQTTSDFANWFVYLTLISTSIGVISAILMNIFLKSIDKYYFYRVVMYVYFVLALVLLPCTIIVTFGSFGTIFTLLCIFAIMNTCVDILRDMMTRDLLVVDAYSTGMNREAMYLTVVNTPLTVIRALISALPLLVIPLSGYHLNSVDDDTLSGRLDFKTSTLWLVRFMSSAYILFAPLAYYCIRNYQITDQKVIAISDEIAKKEAAEKALMDSKVNGSDTLGADKQETSRLGSELGMSKSSLNMSLRLDELQGLILTMLNFSPAEVRSFATRKHTEEVRSNMVKLSRAIFFLSVTSSVFLLALFGYVVDKGNNSWTFLIVFLFLICSMCVLYAYYRTRALGELSDYTLSEIADAAQDTEIQRHNDKAMHQALAKGENFTDGTPDSTRGGGAALAASAGTETAIDLQLLGDLNDSMNSTQEKSTGKSYENESYFLDNLAVASGLGVVILGTAIAFGLL